MLKEPPFVAVPSLVSFGDSDGANVDGNSEKKSTGRRNRCKPFVFSSLQQLLSLRAQRSWREKTLATVDLRRLWRAGSAAAGLGN